MTHPELKAALIEALEKLDAAFPESQANQILSKVDFTPTREQVLRSPETEAIANDFAYFLIRRRGAHTNSTLDEMDHWEDFKGKQLSALTPEPSPQTYPLKTAVGPVLTPEMAKRVCNRLHEMGKKWRGRISYLESPFWKKYGSETCYEINEGGFADLEYHQSNGYTLITPEEFLGIVLVTEDGVEVTDPYQQVCRVIENGFQWVDARFAEPTFKWYSTRAAAEASVKPVILQCQDGPCYDKNHLVHWISNYETGALDTYYAWAYIEEGCKEPCFLTQSACQAYLDSLLIGYECPEDYPSWGVKKGMLFTIIPNGKGLNHAARKGLPGEIVKCWKKIYKKLETK